MALISSDPTTDIIQLWLDEYLAQMGFTLPILDPIVAIPTALDTISTSTTEPAIRESLVLEAFQEIGLGLNPYDVITRITPITFPTTPDPPVDVYALGFDIEIGISWHIQRLVGNHIRAVEIRRATLVDMSDAVVLGEFRGLFWVDKNFPVPEGWGDSIQRFYQIRSVAAVGETPYYSAWTPATPVSGTTLAAGATNVDLQARVDEFTRRVQSQHIFPGAILGSDMSPDVPVLLRVVVPTGVTGDIDTVLAWRGRIIDVWLIKTGGAAVQGDTIQVQTGAGAAITNLIPLWSDQQKIPCETIDDATYDIADAGTVRVRRVNSGAGNVACEVYILFQRIL